MNSPDTEAPRGGHRLQRRHLAGGLVLSVALHGLLALAWRTDPAPPVGAAEASREARAQTPAERWEEPLRAVELAPREAPEVAVPPRPDPVPAPADRVREPGTGEATLARAGLEPRGFRRPSGPGDGDGAAAGGRGPRPRSVLPVWEPPADVRGKRVMVRVYVDSAGRPVGPVEVDPSTGVDEFDRRLREKVREMEFEPARRGGVPVGAWAELTFIF